MIAVWSFFVSELEVPWWIDGAIWYVDKNQTDTRLEMMSWFVTRSDIEIRRKENQEQSNENATPSLDALVMNNKIIFLYLRNTYLSRFLSFISLEYEKDRCDGSCKNRQTSWAGLSWQAGSSNNRDLLYLYISKIMYRRPSKIPNRFWVRQRHWYWWWAPTITTTTWASLWI